MFILRATEQDGTKLYFQNFICVTPQKEHAKTFDTLEEAKANIQDFMNLFYNGEAKFDICEVREIKELFILTGE